MKELSGKVAVVTGGASGIGLAIAQRLGAEGMKLVLADVEEQALHKTVGELEQQGLDVLGVPTDVSHSDQVEALRDRALERFGKVHVVCNNAGVARGGLLWETSLEDWQWVLGVNLFGVIHGVRTFVPVLIEQGEEGHVVNTASIAGLISPPAMGIYNVSKHAVVTLSETLQMELLFRGSQVGVSVLCPGWVKTNIADAERNRPASLRSDANRQISEEEKMADEVARQVVASGMAPSEVAARVVTAIREKQLYILTHPEMKKAVQARFENLIAEKTPGMEILTYLMPRPPGS